MYSDLRLPDRPMVYTAAFEAQAYVSERLRLRRAVASLNAAEAFGPDNELRFISDPGTGQIVVALVSRTTSAVIQVVPVTRILQQMASLSSANTAHEAPEVSDQ